MNDTLSQSIRYYFPALFDGISDYLQRPARLAVVSRRMLTGGARQAFVYDPHGLLLERFRQELEAGCLETGAQDLTIPDEVIAVSETAIPTSPPVTIIVALEIPSWIIHAGPVQRWLAEFAHHASRGTRDPIVFAHLRKFARLAVESVVNQVCFCPPDAPSGATSPQAVPDYDFLIDITRQREEGYYPRGTMIFSSEAAFDTRLLTRFEPRPALDETKRARKMLESVAYVPSQDLYMACAGTRLLGVIARDALPQRYFGVHFRGVVGAEVTVASAGVEHELFTIKEGRYHGAPLRPHMPSIARGLATLTRRLGLRLDAEIAEALAIKVSRAASLGKGCMTVITDDEGILSQGQCLSPPLSLGASPAVDALLVSMSTIDGALVVRTNGEIPAIGVLLDGVAHQPINLAHGARYNAAVRYTQNHPDAVVLTVSEDGPFAIFARGEELTAPSELHHPTGPPSPRPLPTPREYLDAATSAPTLPPTYWG